MNFSLFFKKHIFFISIAAFTSLLLFSCEKNPNDNNDLEICIQGKVSDKNGAPISDAGIQFIYYNQSNNSSTQKVDILETNNRFNVANDTLITITVPDTNILYQNFPNPIYYRTSICFDLKERAFTTLNIYDWPNKNLIRTLLSDTLNAGHYKFFWNGRNNEDILMPNGLYPYKIITDGFEEERTMCNLMLSTEEIESSEPNYKTDAKGEFKIEYADIPVGETIIETNETGPDITDSKMISEEIAIVITKPGYTALSKNITIDNTKNLTLDITLEKKE